jgi:hypothetical protein
MQTRVDLSQGLNFTTPHGVLYHCCLAGLSTTSCVSAQVVAVTGGWGRRHLCVQHG